jgi:uroporphyrinogen-III synthase
VTAGSLAGLRVLVTRERPGRLAAMLETRGASVIHAPLIRVAEPADGGAALRAELRSLERYDWVVVTSVPGAERVGHAAASTSIGLAAVGASTATRLADLVGRPVDVVPERQTAGALADALVSRAAQGARVLLAQADRAGPALADALLAAGVDVTVREAYRTELVAPPPGVADDADVLLLASGSAARGWAAAIGTATPPLVVAIGPSTADVARDVGLDVSAIASDHSVEGLVEATERLVRSASTES